MLFFQIFPSPQFLLSPNENFINISKTLLQKINFSRSALFYMETRVYLKYFFEQLCLETFFDSISPQTPSNLTSLNILVALRSFTMFWPKIRAIKLQKSAKISLSW